MLKSVPFQILLEIFYYHLFLRVDSRHKEENEWTVSKRRQSRARKESKITRKRTRKEKSRERIDGKGVAENFRLQTQESLLRHWQFSLLSTNIDMSN